MGKNTALLIREIAILKELERRKNEPAKVFRPYPKQQEFYELGKEYAERAFFAGNQLGKTLAAAMETYYHLSGRYPDWWQGRRFNRPTIFWIGGDTGETIRDTSQRLLFDRPGKLDTPASYKGIVPLRYLASKPRMASGIADLFDNVKIKHVSGGVSYCYFKAYAKGRKKWQGETIDGVWFDEEPPADIYSEGLTRTNNGQTGQFSYLTFTPLLGISQVVFDFLKNPSPQQVSLTMTISDVEHYTAKERKRIVASYPEHEREARAEGKPIVGAGLVYQVADATISEPHITKIPGWWRRIYGIDFGWDHPSALVYLLYDPENDVIHVHRTHKQRKALPYEFHHAVRNWPAWIPVAWPHDGLQHKGSDKQTAELYKDVGFNMLPMFATFEQGGNGVEAGISEIYTRMKTGRFKVDETCTSFFEEKSMYHRKDGKIVKEMDDVLDATRYAVMMLRFARSEDDELNVDRMPKYEYPLEAEGGWMR